MLKEQIVALISRFVKQQIPVDDFSREFAALYFAVRQSRVPEPDASRLCNGIIGPLAEYSRGHRSLDSLRRELETTSSPFVPRSTRFVSVTRPQQNIPTEIYGRGSREVIVVLGTASRVERSDLFVQLVPAAS